MTAAEYDALKQYLEAPPVTVVPTDSWWAAPLLPEDSNWPTPESPPWVEHYEVSAAGDE